MKMCSGWHNPTSDMQSLDGIIASFEFAHREIVYDDSSCQGRCPLCFDAFKAKYFKACLQDHVSGLITLKQLISRLEGVDGISFIKPAEWDKEE